MNKKKINARHGTTCFLSVLSIAVLSVRSSAVIVNEWTEGAYDFHLTAPEEWTGGIAVPGSIDQWVEPFYPPSVVVSGIALDPDATAANPDVLHVPATTTWDSHGEPGVQTGITITMICDSAASGMDSFRELSFEPPVTNHYEIGRKAFYRCGSLTNVCFEAAVGTGEDGHFTWKPWGDAELSSLGESAFEGCQKLERVVLPANTRRIGSYAFRNCEKLKNVELPDEVDFFGEQVFNRCAALESVSLPRGVVAIDDFAFANCTNLVSVTIPDTVRTIGTGAFRNCSKLEIVNIPNGVTNIDAEAFAMCSSLKTVVIPDTVRLIGQGVFFGCSSLENVTVPFIGKSQDSGGETVSVGFYIGADYARSVDSLTWFFGMSFRYTGGKGFADEYGKAAWPDGACNSGGDGYVTDAKAPKSLRSIVVTRATQVGDFAFRAGGDDMSILLPDTVTNIAEKAFYGCSGLHSVNIPDGVPNIGNHAFYNCSGLVSVTIPASVTNIGNHAFYNCSGLTSVTVPGGVSIIGESAFYGCSGLSSVTISEGVTRVGKEAFSNCSGVESVTIPDSMTNIGLGSFSDCTSLSNLTVGAGVTNIGESAFSRCPLANVSIANQYTLNNIYPSGFYGKNSLKTVVLGAGVTNISRETFKNCSGLTSITMTNGVTSIGNCAFQACSGLTSITIPGSVTSIDDYAFYNCSGLTSVSIPGGVMKIGGHAFDGCAALTSATISDGVECIGDSAFRDCSWLSSVTIPDSVTNIGYNAFCNCALTTITIPDDVASIGNSAFYGCRALLRISFPESFRGKTDGLGIPSGCEIVFRGPLSILTESLPSGAVGAAYSASLEATGGTAPYSWTATGLPAGLSMSTSAAGTIFGTPAVAGTFSVTASVSDEADQTVSRTFHFVVENDGDPPENDAFANASAIEGASGSTEGTNEHATREADEPVYYPDRERGSAWWRWTAPGDGVLVVNTRGSDFDTVLAVYTGTSVDGLSRIAFNDQDGNYDTSRCRFGVSEGVTYFIAVTGYASTGTIVLNWSFAETNPLVIETDATLPTALTEVSYWKTLEVTGGVKPYTWEIADKDEWPDWMSYWYLTNSGALHGCPYSQNVGTNSFTLRVRDADGTCAERTFTLVVEENPNHAPAIDALSPDPKFWDGRVFIGKTASFAVEAHDPDGDPLSFEWSLDGLAIEETGSTWSWTPTREDAGEHVLWVYCSDGARRSAGKKWSFRVESANDLVTDVSLPVAVFGQPYSAAFSVTGGTEPYVWSMPEYAVARTTNSFAETGTSQGWRGDDDCWELALPFEFPFFGASFGSVKVNSNGTLSFGKSNFTDYRYTEISFHGTPMIAVLWTDLKTTGDGCDMFVSSTTSSATIRWKAEYYGGGSVNASATLHADGRIVLAYGAGNATGGFVGISAGAGGRFLSPYALQDGDFGNADDIEFRPAAFAPGVSLSADGTVSGTPAAGTYRTPVTVVDDEGASWSGTAVLYVVNAGDPVTKTTPVPVEHSWLAGHGLGDGTAEGCETAAKSEAGNGRPVWECYVADLDPGDPSDDLVAGIEMVDGKPEVLIERGESASRVYTTQGAKKLGGGWNDLKEGANWDAAGYRFFRVKVELP